MAFSTKKANNIFNSRIDKLFRRVPALGKVFTTLFGAIELPLLDVFHVLDKVFKMNSAEVVGGRIFKGRWGSKVVPLNVNFSLETRFLPTEEIMSIIERSGVVAVAWCYCRTRAQQRGEKKCDNPLYTCIHVGLGKSLYDIPYKSDNLKKISKEEVVALLADAEKRGLVHQIIYFGNPQFYYVICQCCPCCCEVMKNFLKFGSPQMVKSDFIETTDIQKCNNCGACEDWCYFGARKLVNGNLQFEEEKCFGCGVCVPKCPNNAIILQRKINQ